MLSTIIHVCVTCVLDTFVWVLPIAGAELIKKSVDLWFDNRFNK